MLFKTYDFILQGDEATESNAREHAQSFVWAESYQYDSEIKYHHYIDTVNGIDIYYDYIGDYYFFTDEVIV